MPSLIRRIERTVVSSQLHPCFDDDGNPTGKYYRNPPKRRNYMGRGSKLGVSNPKDKARIAREAREARHNAV